MKKPKELPGKKAPKVEEPKKNKSMPAAPVIETPVPPQVMDPSAPPAIERKKNSTSPNERIRKHLKHHARLDDGNR